jgi:hypothetical protein
LWWRARKRQSGSDSRDRYPESRQSLQYRYIFERDGFPVRQEIFPAKHFKIPCKAVWIDGRAERQKERAYEPEEKATIDHRDDAVLFGFVNRCQHSRLELALALLTNNVILDGHIGLHVFPRQHK